MADRMRRLWFLFRSSLVALGVNADARVDILTIVNASQAREVRQYTVTRILVAFSGTVDSGDDTFFTVGVRFENENVAVGTVTLLDLTADWLYNEEIAVNAAAFVQRDRVFRDIRAQRKSRGSDMDLFFYVRGGLVAGDFNVSGRVLVLIP